jgi:hypothetical protein
MPPFDFRFSPAARYRLIWARAAFCLTLLFLLCAARGDTRVLRQARALLRGWANNFTIPCGASFFYAWATAFADAQVVELPKRFVIYD